MYCENWKGIHGKWNNNNSAWTDDSVQYLRTHGHNVYPGIMGIMERTRALGPACLAGNIHSAFASCEATRPPRTLISSFMKRGSKFLLHRICVKTYQDAISSWPYASTAVQKYFCKGKGLYWLRWGVDMKSISPLANQEGSLQQEGLDFLFKNKKLPKKLYFIETGKRQRIWFI